MTPEELLLKGTQIGTYKRMEWIRSLFCVTAEGEDAYLKDPYNYRLVFNRQGAFFIDPDNDNKLSKLDTGNKKLDEPLLTPSSILSIPKGTLPNVDRDIKNTTVGNVIVNAICLIYPFGNKIPFLEGEITPSKIEDIILERLHDNPEDPKERKQEFIYVDEYLRFTESMLMIRNMTDIVVPGATETNMTPPDGVIEYRNKLMKENTGKLQDPAVLADIDKKLVAYDAEYLAKDPSGLAFLQKKKMRNEVRRKLFLTVGGLSGFGDGTTVTDVPKSLSEGMDVQSIPAMNSDSRAGSFNRGHQTMLGGAKFKELIRAAANAKIEEEDCHTTMGSPEFITRENAPLFIGRYILVDGKDEFLDENSIKKYIGKNVMIRSPMYCKSEKTDYCKHCVGDRLALHPTAISVAVSDIGSAFLTLFLKKMHVSGLTTAEMDYLEEIS